MVGFGYPQPPKGGFSLYYPEVAPDRTEKDINVYNRMMRVRFMILLLNFDFAKAYL